MIQIPVEIIYAAAAVVIVILVASTITLLKKKRRVKCLSEPDKAKTFKEAEAKAETFLPFNWRRIYMKMWGCRLYCDSRIVLMKYIHDSSLQNPDWKGNLSPRALELLCTEMRTTLAGRAATFEEFVGLLEDIS